MAARPATPFALSRAMSGALPRPRPRPCRTTRLTPVPIHVRANPGDYAEACLLPGDPLRAQYIAETYFDDPVQRNSEHHVFPWGQRSGTLVSEIDRIQAGGSVPLLELETEGALNVAERVPGAITIFVTAPLPELERRLRERATESAGEIEERVRVAQEQLQVAGRFDYAIENDELGRAANDLAAIVKRELEAAATMSER